jgi:hypothetical protein
MIKTKALIAVLLFGLLSCRQTKTANNHVDNKPKIVNKDSSIIGEWLIYATEHLREDGRSVPGQCNSCPVITFLNNHSGNFRTEGGDLIYSFKWSFEKGNLAISYPINNKTKDIILEGTFKIIYPNKKLPHRIDLLDTIRHIKYWLD